MISHHSSSSCTAFPFRKNRKGQTLAEYSLILALLSVVLMAVLISLGSNVKGTFSNVTTQITIAGNSGGGPPPPHGGGG